MGTHPIFESDFDCLTDKNRNMPIGPPLPPHLRPKEDIGPTLPPTVCNQESDSDEDIGPTLPPHLRKRPTEDTTEPVGPKRPKNDEQIELNSSSDEDFGPALPGPAQKGPTLPAEFRQMLAEQNPLYAENADLEKYSRPIEEVMAEQKPVEEDDEPVVGPVMPVLLSPEEQAELDREAIIKRSEAMKKKIEGGDQKKLERESWMTELPALRTGVKFQNQTTFRKHGSAAVECGRSEWTKTPNASGKSTTSLAERKKEDKQKVMNLAEWERNQKQMAKMKSLQKNQESLLSSHQKKMEAEEEKDTGPKMRVAFDREKDMQGSIMDDAKRKAMLKKTMGLGNRFATGASKFL